MNCDLCKKNLPHLFVTGYFVDHGFYRVCFDCCSIYTNQHPDLPKDHIALKMGKAIKELNA